MIKRFLLILVIIFSLQSLIKADDIRDFEIEGMSIGDSLLDYMSKNEIIDNGIYGSDSKFFEVEYLGTLSMYDHFTLYVIRNDPNYLIHAIRAINVVDNKNDCLNSKKEIFKEMKKVFAGKEFSEMTQNHYYYKNSKQYVSQFYLGNKNTVESDLSRIECVIMDKKDLEKHGDIANTLEVIIYTEDFAKWLESL